MNASAMDRDMYDRLFPLFVADARQAVARESGSTLRRTESLNTSPTFISMLEDLVRSML